MKPVEDRAFFATDGLLAHDHGYSICPVVPCKKAPVIPNWSRLAFAPASTDLVKKWATKWATHSIGFPCGRVIGIDVDMTDPAEAERLEAFIVAYPAAVPGRPESRKTCGSEAAIHSGQTSQNPCHPGARMKLTKRRWIEPSREMWPVLKELKARGIWFTVHTPEHLKVGTVNYWPCSGRNGTPTRRAPRNDSAMVLSGHPLQMAGPSHRAFRLSHRDCGLGPKCCGFPGQTLVREGLARETSKVFMMDDFYSRLGPHEALCGLIKMDLCRKRWNVESFGQGQLSAAMRMALQAVTDWDSQPTALR